MTRTPDTGYDERQEARQDLAGYDIRRHNDGSIDFDFYRARATALRNQPSRKPSGTLAPMSVRRSSNGGCAWCCCRAAVDLPVSPNVCRGSSRQEMYAALSSGKGLTSIRFSVVRLQRVETWSVPASASGPAKTVT
jgi:hypothetical protein